MSEQTGAEWGQRRRRREEERRRLVGDESGAVPAVTSPAPEAPSPPQSRREVRERAAAAAAQAAPPAAAPARPEAQMTTPRSAAPMARQTVQPTVRSTPRLAAPAVRPAPTPTAAPVPPPEAPAPAPAPQRVLSRRELREQAAAQQTPVAPAHPDPAQPAPRRPAAALPAAAETPLPASSPLSPQARAAAIRAQAARAQAEREEAAQEQVDRVHSQRAAAAQRGTQAQRQAQGGQDGPDRAPSMWTRPTAPAPDAGGRGPADRPAQPEAPAAAAPGRARAAQAELHPVRRVVLPPAEPPADLAPAAGQGVRSDERAAAPAVPGGYTPVVAAYARPTHAHAGPAQGSGPSNGTPASRPASDAVDGLAAQVAFVPAGVAPAVGQPFGTVAMPNGRAAAPASVVPATPGVPTAQAFPVQAFPTIQVPSTSRSAAPKVSEDSGPVPQWGMVTSSPWTSTSTVGSFGSTPSTGGSSGATPSQEPLLDEPEDEAPRHPYTWLHMIVLVLVAFVLGMLIFMAVSQDDPGGAAALPAAVVVLLGFTEGTGA